MVHAAWVHLTLHCPVFIPHPVYLYSAVVAEFTADACEVSQRVSGCELKIGMGGWLQTGEMLRIVCLALPDTSR